MNGSWLCLGIPLVAAILLVLCVQKGGAIICWECNSRYDPDCRDPFNNHSISLADCDQRTLNKYPDKKAAVCRKIIQKVNDEYRYVRGCGWFPEDRVGMECIKRAGTFHVLVQYCSCNTDKCNSAHSSFGHASWWMIVPAVSALALLTSKQHH